MCMHGMHGMCMCMCTHGMCVHYYSISTPAYAVTASSYMVTGARRDGLAVPRDAAWRGPTAASDVALGGSGFSQCATAAAAATLSAAAAATLAAAAASPVAAATFAAAAYTAAAAGGVHARRLQGGPTAAVHLV